LRQQEVLAAIHAIERTLAALRAQLDHLVAKIQD
jgi:hypothetical protein